MTSPQFNVISNRLRAHSLDWEKVREIDVGTASDIIQLLNQGGREQAVRQIKHLTSYIRYAEREARKNGETVFSPSLDDIANKIEAFFFGLAK